MPGTAVTRPSDDRAFIEREMFHGHGSRRPVRRLLPRLVPILFLLTGGVGFLMGWINSGEPEPALFEVPLPGGPFLVFVKTLMGAAMVVGGLVLLGRAVRAFREDRALARRARNG